MLVLLYNLLSYYSVIPAKAGIHCIKSFKVKMDSRFRGNDGI
jgi:hypothetical protein